MITDLGWESLKQRRDKRDIELFYKIHYHSVDIPFPTEVVPAACLRTRGHDLRYSQLACAVNAYKHSFFPRAIKAWNSSPISVVMADDLAALKAAQM